MTADLACKRCAASNRHTPAEVTTYWGDPLCRECARAVYALLYEHDRWPPAYGVTMNYARS